MKPSLQLKIGQHLTMTPQLQQAIRLLQLSTLELSQEILEQLYSNPLLEEEEASDNSAEESEPSAESSASNDDATELQEPDPWAEDIPQDLPVDADWDDVYSTSPLPTPSQDSGEQVNLEEVHRVTETLQDHLLWQLNLTRFSPTDKKIAEAFIDAIDSNGFLTSDLDELVSHLRAVPDQEPIERDEMIAVLHRLQQFDPPGIFARDVQECLLIQLNQLNADTPCLDIAKRLVKRYLKEVASMDLSRLARKAGYTEEETHQAILLIRGLNPRPGEAVGGTEADYITPDVFVEKSRGRWRVFLNDSSMLRLRINENYSGLIRRADNSEENQFLKSNLAEARWFLRSLESRNETLMRVATSIVEIQQNFLEYGPVAMKPMVLSHIAEQLEMHESTISRVTTNKYISTPRGVFELKYFFSSHVGTAAGGECSSTAVCAMLQEMIKAENPAKPLSDSKLAALLEEQGIQVARRTVAKYRESIGIPSSSDRRRVIHTI